MTSTTANSDAYRALASRGASKPQTTTIGEGMRITGDLVAGEDVVILGQVQGRIWCRGNVTVSAGARVTASVDAHSVVIIGEVQGTIDADKIELRKTARLVGDLKCARLLIEDGAYFKGSIDISKSVRPRVGLALQGSSEAEDLDRIAESDIEAGRYTTLVEDFSLERLLSFEGPVQQNVGQTVSNSY